jgi:uncharacterized iron-regulated membrane protein
MIKSALGKVMWVGRASVFVVGLAVILAMVMGLASAAFSATGGNFILGQSNSANAPTTLVGQIVDTTKSALVLKNPNGGSALQLQANSGIAPMKVNAAAGKATNLNADKLDGKDSTQFTPTTNYVTTQASPSIGNGAISANAASCDQGDGDVLLSGGVQLNAPAQQEVVESRPIDDPNLDSWRGSVRDNTPSTTGAGYAVTALCADLGTPHTP